jgi:preprotein translocase subunit YajC
MNWHDISAVLAQGPTPTQSGGPGQPTMPLWANLFPLVLLIVVFYFALIRPQQKKAKEHTELLKTVKTGDKVVTSGGIIGMVVGVKEKSLSIRSADTKLEILKSAVSEIVEKANGPAES